MTYESKIKMEFFKIIDIASSAAQIQEWLKTERLQEINDEIVILDGDDSLFTMGCIWGEFTIRKDPVKGGIRFSMLDCPNALAWTITTGYPPERDKIIIHLTINRTQKQEHFIDEINEFIESWGNGIYNYLKIKK